VGKHIDPDDERRIGDARKNQPGALLDRQQTGDAGHGDALKRAERVVRGSQVTRELGREDVPPRSILARAAGHESLQGADLGLGGRQHQAYPPSVNPGQLRTRLLNRLGQRTIRQSVGAGIGPIGIRSTRQVPDAIRHRPTIFVM